MRIIIKKNQKKGGYKKMCIIVPAHLHAVIVDEANKLGMKRSAFLLEQIRKAIGLEGQSKGVVIK